MSQILIEEAVTQIGKKYSGLPGVKTLIKKCDSLIHCDLRKGLLLIKNLTYPKWQGCSKLRG